METESSGPAAESSAMDVEVSGSGQPASALGQGVDAEQPAPQPSGPPGDVDMTGPSSEGDASQQLPQPPPAPPTPSGIALQECEEFSPRSSTQPQRMHLFSILCLRKTWSHAKHLVRRGRFADHA